MGGKLDEAKGQAKKAAAEITDDPSLRDRGRIDKGSASVKRRAGKTAKKAKHGLRRAS